AVGDEHRRHILEAIDGAELGVGEIVESVALPQPQVSKHLKVLRDAGLVHCERVGRRRVYRVDGAALRPLHDWITRFERLWNERYDRLDDLLVELQEGTTR
ncbi:MAG: ArsR/SmtB family transcription factor, partial [Acidimicrobiia bacterium]